MPKHTSAFCAPLCKLLLLPLLVACRLAQVEPPPLPTSVVVSNTVVTVQTIEVTRIVVETIIEQPQETPPPSTAEKELVVCLAAEPTSLFMYVPTPSPAQVQAHAAAQAVRHALFTNYLTMRSFSYQADGLLKVPSLADGDALLQTIEVSAGQTVLNAANEVVTLDEGVEVVTAEGETAVFRGTPLLMNQLVVDFTLEPTMWSDGTPVQASDSLFAFRVGADPVMPTDKFLYARTASYEALGERQVRWTGIPGFYDSTYFLNFWRPLPEHLLGNYAPAELLTAVVATRLPIGDGPFHLVEWIPGEQMRLERNEFYYRAGLPHLDRVIFRFIPDANQRLSLLLRGECHVLTQDGLELGQAPFLLEAEANGLLVAHFQTGTVYELIALGINPYPSADALNRPDWFEDVRVRQAIAMCIDRQRMVDEFLYGRSTVMHSYIPAMHPLYPAGELPEWPYDVAAANALLDQVGFVDLDGNGIREYYAAEAPNNSNFSPSAWDGRSFRITLMTNSDEVRQPLAQILRDNMRQCGISVELAYLPTSEWLADGPSGPLFGRRFDLGYFPWKTNVEQTGFAPLCQLYQRAHTPGPVEQGFGGWSAPNVSGWSNAAFDALCIQARRSLPGTAVYEEAHRAAQLIFAQELPVIPLFLRLRVAAAHPRVRNFSLDATQPSELFNLYEIDLLP